MTLFLYLDPAMPDAAGSYPWTSQFAYFLSQFELGF